MCLSVATSHFEMGGGHQFNDEASVVAAAKSGDRWAFNVLAENYQKKVLNTVRRITRNPDDAEDLTQQALMKAFLKVRDFRGTCAFSTWLTRIAINEALMWRRRVQVRSEISWPGASALEEPGIVPEIADTRPNPEQCYARKERFQLLVTAMKKLKPASRLALEVCDLNECSVNDLALVQGTSLGAAKSRLYRGRNLLRAKFARSPHRSD